MASSLISEAKGFEIQTSDIRSPLNGLVKPWHQLACSPCYSGTSSGKICLKFVITFFHSRDLYKTINNLLNNILRNNELSPWGLMD